MKIELDIPAQYIADQMITAIEGGSNYWCSGIFLHAAGLTMQQVRDGGEKLASPWYSDVRLYAGAHVVMEVHEQGDEDKPKKRKINQADFAKGLQIMAATHPQHFGDLMAEKGDATTADVFLQCVALGEVVYG